jgi:hypothetical protein
MPSLAAGFAAVNASTAVYNAASVIRRRSGGLKNKTIDQAQHWVCWKAVHDTKNLNESGDGGDGN